MALNWLKFNALFERFQYKINFAVEILSSNYKKIDELSHTKLYVFKYLIKFELNET